MTSHSIVSRDQWLAARKTLLAKEKELTRARDALARMRRELPWTRIDKSYVFESNTGPRSLADLFGPHGQLIIYHFMFHPDWSVGCKSCSFWADTFNPMIVHLNQRDVAMAAVSRAPLAKLNAFKRRMGWSFEWVSSLHNSFNYDFAVSFTPNQIGAGGNYNFGTSDFKGEEAPGVSVFVKDGAGRLYHSYSTFGRGLDALNNAYSLLDLTPKGRDEDALPYPMAWVRLRDEYDKPLPPSAAAVES